jgi:hypothetical protein
MSPLPSGTPTGRVNGSENVSWNRLARPIFNVIGTTKPYCSGASRSNSVPTSTSSHPGATQ